MLGTVQEIGSSQSGRPKLKIGGKYYSLKQAQMANGISVGQQVEFTSEPYEYNGKTYHSITNLRPASNPVTASGSGGGVADDSMMRFISNCVGSAIVAKTITEPGQINAWFQAAKAAISGKPAPIPFDDDPPGYDEHPPGWDRQ